MKIIYISVSSLDGKITKWKNGIASEWASAEDQKYFREIIAENTLLVMGSGTYLAYKPKAIRNRLVLVMTHDPAQYRQHTVAGQVEFSNETPKQLAVRLEMEGFANMLLVSGGRLAASFFEEKLVNEFWLTLEPRIFGTGSFLVADMKLDIRLQLISQEMLNRQGTLLLKYTVIS